MTGDRISFLDAVAACRVLSHGVRGAGGEGGGLGVAGAAGTDSVGSHSWQLFGQAQLGTLQLRLVARGEALGVHLSVCTGDDAHLSPSGRSLASLLIYSRSRR